MDKPVKLDEKQMIFVKGAVAGLSQNATYPSDVKQAIAWLQDALTPDEDSKTVFVVLVIKAGILEVSRVFADEGAADEFYEDMKEEYNIDPLNPDTCAEDVLCLREQVMQADKEVYSMNKKQAVQEFKDNVLPLIQEQYEQDGIPDWPARREAWCNFTDYLAKDGQITARQDYNWTYPDCCNG